MPLRETLRMGEESVDREHEQSLDMVEQLTEALESRDDAVVSKLLDTFCKHFPNHFYDEENLMSRLRYPGLAHHKVNHNEIINYLRNVRAAIASDGSVKRDVAVMVVKWVTHHLEESDLKLAEFIRENAAADPGKKAG